MVKVAKIGGRAFLRIGSTGETLIPIEEIRQISLAEPLLKGMPDYNQAVDAGRAPIYAIIRCVDKAHNIRHPDYDELVEFLDKS
jgi:hypothetical protein